MPSEVDTVFGPKERERLLAAAGRSSTPHRDRAVLHLFIHYGATPRQVLALEIGNVNFPAGRLHWPTAGVETRLPAELLVDLTKYVALERNPRSPSLFTTRLGHPMSIARLSALFRRLREESGIAVTPLALRRGCLHRWLEEQPVEAVSGLLGGWREGVGPRVLRVRLQPSD